MILESWLHDFTISFSNLVFSVPLHSGHTTKHLIFIGLSYERPYLVLGPKPHHDLHFLLPVCKLADYSVNWQITCVICRITLVNYLISGLQTPILITVLDTVEVTPFFQKFSPCFEVACKLAVYSKAVV